MEGEWSSSTSVLNYTPDEVFFQDYITITADVGTSAINVVLYYHYEKWGKPTSIVLFVTFVLFLVVFEGTDAVLQSNTVRDSGLWALQNSRNEHLFRLLQERGGSVENISKKSGASVCVCV